MVEAEAELEEHLPFDHSRRDPGVARGCTHGTEQDGVAGAEIAEDFLGECLAGLEPVLRAERVVRLLQGDAFGGNNLLQYLQGFGDDLGADAVAGDDSKIDRGCAHAFSVAKRST